MNKESANRDLIGIGLYSVPEAARLTHISAARLRRWLLGYDHGKKEDTRHAPPVLKRDIEVIDGYAALSFLDLIEARFVDAFLRQGVSWREIRAASAAASGMLESPHPFATYRFITDGRSIFAEILNHASDPALIHLSGQQYVIKEVLAPSLRKGLEFENDNLVRWRPFGGRHPVVLDPKRAFGRPIVEQSGVPTHILACAFKAEGGEQKNALSIVARHFDITKREVTAAVEFERQVAA
ncbi:MAG: DUF433 domain-containing protein [Pseudomonadota bacterium]